MHYRINKPPPPPPPQPLLLLLTYKYASRADELRVVAC